MAGAHNGSAVGKRGVWRQTDLAEVIHTKQRDGQQAEYEKSDDPHGLAPKPPGPVGLRRARATAAVRALARVECG